MKLKEIKIIEMGERVALQLSHGIPLDKFKNYKKIGELNLSSSMIFKILKSEINDNLICYKLKLNDNDIFYFVGIEWENNIQIKRTWINPEYRNKNIATQFYRKMFKDFNFNLISDFELSPESISIWKKLISQYPNNVHLTNSSLEDLGILKNIDEYFKNQNYLIMLVNSKNVDENRIPKFNNSFLTEYSIGDNLQ